MYAYTHVRQALQLAAAKTLVVGAPTCTRPRHPKDPRRVRRARAVPFRTVAHLDLLVQATRPKQCVIEGVPAVRSSEDEHA